MKSGGMQLRGGLPLGPGGAVAVAACAACLLVGTAQAATPNVSPGRPLAIPGTHELLSVDCATAGCTAVGFGRKHVLLVPVSGQRPGMPRPVSGPAVSLDDIACPSAATCEAVGFDTANEGVVVRIAGGSPGRSTVVDTGLLYAVACASPSHCEAVGSNGNGQGVVIPIDHGIPGTPATVAGATLLHGIACPGPTTCQAVGYNADGEGVVVPIKAGAPGAPVAVSGTFILESVSCPRAGSCVAVGEDRFAQGVVVSITAGKPGAPKSSQENELFDVACSSPTTCLAAGTNQQGTVTPITDGAPGAPITVKSTKALFGVACPSATGCLAVGGGAAGRGVVVPVTIAGGTVGTVRPQARNRHRHRHRRHHHHHRHRLVGSIAPSPAGAAGGGPPAAVSFYCSDTRDGAMSYPVPKGLTDYLVTVTGGSGASALGGGGGGGGETGGLVAVKPGEVLRVTVGCTGSGFGGGGHGDGSGGNGASGNGVGRGGAGGGGASSVAGGSGSSAFRLVAGGGGGGGGEGYDFGGDGFSGGAGGGGGRSAQAGQAGQGTNFNGPLPGGSAGCGACVNGPHGQNAPAGNGLMEGGGGGGGGGCRGGSPGGPGDYMAGGGGGGGGSSCSDGAVRDVSYVDGHSSFDGTVTLIPELRRTFGCRQRATSMVVPDGPWATAQVQAAGAQGGGSSNGAGGLGGEVDTTGSVSVGETLTATVGCKGHAGDIAHAFGSGRGGAGGGTDAGGGGGGTQIHAAAWSVIAGGGGGSGSNLLGILLAGGGGGRHPGAGGPGAGSKASGGAGSQAGQDGAHGHPATPQVYGRGGGGGGGGCHGGGAGGPSGFLNGGGGGGSSCVGGTLRSVKYVDHNHHGDGSASVVLLPGALSATTVSASASPQDGVSSTTFAFTAAVSTAGSASYVPNGTVRFAQGSKDLPGCSVVPITNGKATCKAALNHGGSYAVDMAYSGTTRLAPSFGSVSGFLAPTDTTMSMTATPTTAHNGATITLKAAIKPNIGTRIPTGTIQFSDNYYPALGPPARIDSTGTATVTAAIHGLGKHTLRAEYTQNDDFYNSAAAVEVTVVPAHQSTSIAAKQL